ncbi:MAG: metallophosphoesterase [Oligoflexales bacterium]|nr:metallophosphoesterase [Oligoflexales bacterium]
MSEENWLEEASLVVVSDLHIKNIHDDNGRLFLRFLDNLMACKIDCLVLIGDVFDFILGSKRFYHKKFEPIGNALMKLAQKGVRIVYLEGNHEFMLKSLGWKGIEFIDSCSDGLIIPLEGGRKVKIGHGDLIYSSLVYRSFRAIVKSRLFLLLVNLLPGRLIDYFSIKGSQASRSQDKYRPILHDEILEAAELWARRSGCDFCLFGHFHVPYYEKMKSGEGYLISLSHWESQPSFLAFSNGRFVRLGIGFKRDGLDFFKATDFSKGVSEQGSDY